MGVSIRKLVKASKSRHTYDDQKAVCIEGVKDVKDGRVIEGALRPYEKVHFPDWCKF